MIYISGPITGDMLANYKFTIAEKWIKANIDQSVINPEKIFKPLTSAPYDQLIKSCCMLAANCDIIALLPQWEKSFGACKELLAYLVANDYPIVQLLYLKMINDRMAVGWVEAIPEGDRTAADTLKATCRKRLAKGRKLLTKDKLKPFIE